MKRSNTKIKKIQEANLILENRRFKGEEEDNLDFSIKFDSDDEDYGEEDDTSFEIDTEKDYEDDDFQKEMEFRDFMRKNKPSSVGIGDKVRWDSESEKEYSPLKPTDIPLEKYLELKKTQNRISKEKKNMAESFIRKVVKGVIKEENLDKQMDNLKKKLEDALTPEQKRVIRKELKIGGIEGLEDELERVYQNSSEEMSEDFESQDRELGKANQKETLAGIFTILPTLGAAGLMILKLFHGENFEYGAELLATILASAVGFGYTIKQGDKAKEIESGMESQATDMNKPIIKRLKELRDQGIVDYQFSKANEEECSNEYKPNKWKSDGSYKTGTYSSGKKYINIQYCDSKNLNYLLQKSMIELGL